MTNLIVLALCALAVLMFTEPLFGTLGAIAFFGLWRMAR